MGKLWDIPWDKHRKKCGKAMVSGSENDRLSWWIFHIYVGLPQGSSWLTSQSV
jgi:hypothetical protein